MYAYIEGIFTHKTPTVVYIDIGGLAYYINISLQTYSKIESLDEGRLYLYLHVKEDSHTLFGFYNEEEKDLFINLISVSGIGPNTARIVLSSMTPLEVRTAIVTENDTAFKKVKGVGPKTAKRLILDLKDKVKHGEISRQRFHQENSNTEQAITALIALGFHRQKVLKSLERIASPDDMSTEQIIKSALHYLT